MAYSRNILVHAGTLAGVVSSISLAGALAATPAHADEPTPASTTPITETQGNEDIGAPIEAEPLNGPVEPAPPDDPIVSAGTPDQQQAPLTSDSGEEGQEDTNPAGNADEVGPDESEAPQTEMPQADEPQTEASQADKPQAETPPAEEPQAEKIPPAQPGSTEPAAPDPLDGLFATPLANEVVEGDVAYAVTATEPTAQACLAEYGAILRLSASGGDLDRAWGVSFAVKGAKGTVWVPAEFQEGTWQAELSAAACGTGNVSIEAWAHVADRSAACLATAEATVPGTTATPALSYDPTAKRLTLSASRVSCPTGVVFVSVGVCAPDGTERWYRLTKQSDGGWACAIDPSDYSWQAGSYRLVASICDADWKGVAGEIATCTISYGTEHIGASTSPDGSGLTLDAGGGRLDAAWGAAFELTGSLGSTWVAAVRQPDGSWHADISAGSLGPGTVTANVWVNVGSSRAFAVCKTTVDVSRAKADLGLAYDDSSGRLVVSAQNVSCPTGVSFVSVGVTSPAGTCRWYRLAENPDGTLSTTVDPSDFDWKTGTYTLNGAICDSTWNGVSIEGATVAVSFGAETFEATTDDARATVTVCVSGGRYAQAGNVAFHVYGASQGTWVGATRQPDGSWIATFEAEQVGGGLLTVSSYATVGTGTFSVGTAQVRTYSNTPEVAATVQPADSSVLLIAAGGVFSKADNVAFSVTNVTMGSTASWYQAFRQADGSWTATISAGIDGVGTCTVEAWATCNGDTASYASNRYTYRIVPVTSTEIYLGGGDYDVSYGMSGLKVLRIQQALGIGNPNYPRYLDQTVSAVKSFQTRIGLPATGVVDRATWLALGLNATEWYTLGAYVSPVQVDAQASADQRIEAMVSRASDYLGDSYVWDASGAPGQGVDCAGLIMQALYAAGLDTGIINPVTHASTAWGDRDALNFYDYGGFTKIDIASRKRGDLIYYGSSVINHVAIYLGNDTIIEAYPTVVRTSSLWSSNILGVTRVFG